MIDIVGALDLLDSCVRDRGESYRSTLQLGPDSRGGRRYPTYPAVTDSIVTLVLTKAGAPPTTISRLAATSVGDAYASGERDLDLTVGAVVVLRAAESMERRGETWGLARQAAVQAASRFADLILDVPPTVGRKPCRGGLRSRPSSPSSRRTPRLSARSTPDS
jgi:hypothetical protein